MEELKEEKLKHAAVADKAQAESVAKSDVAEEKLEASEAAKEAVEEAVPWRSSHI